MKIIVAPDSFKGSLSSEEAAKAMCQAVKEVFPEAQMIVLPISDGGEGAAQVLASALPGKFYVKEVIGPYGSKVNASYFLAESGLGIVELAEASGLTLTSPQERFPIHSTTYGVGELLLEALERGATKLCLTLGGSATNDGGAGIAKALGIRLLDSCGREVAPTCAGLSRLASIDASHLPAKLKNIPILIACDVKNPLCGPEGASYIYGPQKGADEDMVKTMDAILGQYEKLLSEISGKKNIGILPGSGAAGGAAIPLIAFLDANLISGIDLILDTLEFEKHLENAALVLTGEGKIDHQTKYGKAIDGIVMRAQKAGVLVMAFAGCLGEGLGEYSQGGASFYKINPADESYEQSIKRAFENLKTACRKALQEFQESVGAK